MEKHSVCETEVQREQRKCVRVRKEIEKEEKKKTGRVVWSGGGGHIHET